MRFVVRFGIGDGYVWSADIVTPVECESAEQLLFNCQLSTDIEQRVRALHKKKDSGQEILELWRKEKEQRKDPEVHLFGKKWDLAYFWSFDNKLVLDIEIFTVDEWFVREGVIC
jgi:hypothetical protein